MNLISKFKGIFASTESKDSVERMIESSGDIWLHREWRRWIMAQMFKNLKWGRGELSEKNIDRRLKQYSAWRAKKIVKEDLQAQKRLIAHNELEEVKERSRWYNQGILDGLKGCSMANEAFKDAYKGTGAYFTMKNMIMFHGCVFYEGGEAMTREESLERLKSLNENRSITGSQMVQIMLSLISDNKFSYGVKKI